ncbi:MAG: S41 family peptidase [Planctomycetota bacterium]|nr:S41 family peptidase [Planctomycetota bacterium]
MSGPSLAAFAAALVSFAAPAAAQTKLLRFPDIHGDRVAFCYAGDLWLAPSGGGTATRLTAHPGLELFPKFSPDGAWIAFTGQYDGDEQVYVVPSQGGVPKQLTFYPARGPLAQRWGYDNQVYGFSRDGRSVLFRSMRDGWDLTDTRLYTVPLGGGPPTALAMPVSGGGDFSPDGKQAVYSPLTRDFRTWKRYEGGWAQDLYVFDFATASIEPVSPSKRTERDPMWIDRRVWFVSDRDGTLNLYSYDLDSKKTEQHTREAQYDVRWASRGDAGEIVFELNGELVVYDTKAGTQKKLDIRVPDDGVSSRPSSIPAAKNLEGSSLSPKGERALFVARGDVFTAPIEKGPTRNLTNSSKAHDRLARWSPDGAHIAYVSDASGEEEIWLRAQDGAGAATQLTSGSTERKTGLEWSPDGKRIAFATKSGRLHVLDLASKVVNEVARDRSGNLGDYQWSPDSAWLAFSLTDENALRSLWIWGGSDGGLRRVTDELWSESEPVWDPAGDFLYFLSDREFAPQLMGLEWNFAVNRSTGIYALALRPDVAHPFPPQSDEVTLPKSEDGAKKDEAPKADEAKKDAAADKPAKPVVIDFEGLAARVVRIPVEPDNYDSLSANAEHLFYVKRGASYYGRESDSEPVLVAFARKERKASHLVENCAGYSLSADGSKILASVGGAFALYDANAKGKDSKKEVSTAGLVCDRVPKDEWRTAFHEVWRRFRDYFYAPNMHGYDWQALRTQYEPLLEHVAHRADLNYLLGEMVAELNVGHAYVAGGDWDLPERTPVALFGGRLEVDAQSGRYRIARILRGQNEEERYRSPLTELGVKVEVGDFVLAIDGVDLRADTDPYQLLRGKADRPVEFLVNSRPTAEGARKVVFRPRTSETDLFYLDWVLTNRERVDKLSGGRLAYIHMPDMSEDGIREFIKWYYGQVRKEGLIVDDRNNGGGNVSQMLIERLRRVLLATEYSRNSDFTGTYPQVVFHGPMVCLINQNSASDGDIFPWMFQQAKLGPVIGKRSWGGVVGITNHGPLIDGGTVNVPEFGHADKNGQWAVEGWGVEPDIEIENDPAATLKGGDPQLERAVQEVLEALRKNPLKLPARPADPIKTK